MRLEPSISGVHVEGGPNPVRSMEFSLSSIERVDYLRQGSFNLRSGSFSLILPGSRRRPVQLLLVRPAMCYIAAFKLLACAALSAVTGACVYAYRIKHQTVVNIFALSFTVTGDIGTVQSPNGWVALAGAPGLTETLLQWSDLDPPYGLPAFGILSGFQITSDSGPGIVAFSTFDGSEPLIRDPSPNQPRTSRAVRSLSGSMASSSYARNRPECTGNENNYQRRRGIRGDRKIAKHNGAYTLPPICRADTARHSGRAEEIVYGPEHLRRALRAGVGLIA